MSSTELSLTSAPPVGTTALPATTPTTTGRRRRRPKDDDRPIKRRTKTGCLTCRTRRIKCDEARPFCQNCQKSRRECEFQSHRWIPDAPGRIRPADGRGQRHVQQARPSLSAMNPPDHGVLPSTSTYPDPSYPNASHSPEAANVCVDIGPHAWPIHQNGSGILPNDPLIQPSASADWTAINSTHHEPDMRILYEVGNLDQHQDSYVIRRPSYHAPVAGVAEEARMESSYPDAYSTQRHAAAEEALPPFHRHDSLAHYEDASTQTAIRHSRDTLLHFPGSSIDAWDSYPLNTLNCLAAFVGDNADSLDPLAEDIPSWPAFAHLGSSQFLDRAAVEYQDDDYYDVNADDQDDVSEPSLMLTNGSLQRDLTQILTLTERSMSLAVAAVRDPSSYTYPFEMAYYIPEQAANPLRNEYTQRVFAHFIFSTGPTISFLSQRNRPTFPGESLQTGAAYSSQGLWTRVLAMMALHDQGLLQAMLAMSSYHLAKLQGATTTPAQKHYVYAIKHIHRSVRPNKRRHEVTTLAATLLLAFYEVMTADHRAWDTHLVGAIQLVKEIDFIGMTAHIKHCKYQNLVKRRSSTASARDNLVDCIFPDVDVRLANQMMGRKTTYDGYGRLIEEWPASYKTSNLTDVDIRNYSILQDLYWYACRHDLIHGLVGGNPLMLEYSRWGDCPPRGPVGHEDFVHGTYDHICLLVGRLVKFISKDRPRKIRAARAKACNHPTPPPDVTSPIPPIAPNGPLPGPGFYGMAPSNGIPHLPPAFEPQQPYFIPSHVSTPVENDLDAATRHAQSEWEDIIRAFHALEAAMGPAFQPLPADDNLHPSVDTPFGPSLHYRSASIAATWTWFYAALIMAYRAHPGMPAPTLVAVGAAAPQTAPYAFKVGQIMYHLTSDFLRPPLDPNSAGAFTECCLPLFFAGVQFMTDLQRRWALQRLQEIEGVTGWNTISLIASGCEASWVAAYERGVGPEWKKSYGVVMHDDEPPVEDVALPVDPVLNDSLPTDRVDLEMQDAHLRHVQREKQFRAFTRRDGGKMWAYKFWNTDDGREDQVV